MATAKNGRKNAIAFVLHVNYISVKQRPAD